jgi:hypothetical protein
VKFTVRFWTLPASSTISSSTRYFTPPVKLRVIVTLRLPASRSPVTFPTSTVGAIGVKLFPFRGVDDEASLPERDGCVRDDGEGQAGERREQAPGPARHEGRLAVKEIVRVATLPASSTIRSEIR